MKPPTIRRAQAEDAEAITDLVQAAYSPYLARMPRRPAPMDDDYTRVIATADVRVALHTDATFASIANASSRSETGSDAADGHSAPAAAVVGVLVVRRHDDHVLVENLAVHPLAQGLGIGAQLLAVVDEFACAAGVDEIRLYTNAAMTENLSYYPRQGYAVSHRAVDEGFDRVFFTKRLG